MVAAFAKCITAERCGTGCWAEGANPDRIRCWNKDRMHEYKFKLLLQTIWVCVTITSSGTSAENSLLSEYLICIFLSRTFSSITICHPVLRIVFWTDTPAFCLRLNGIIDPLPFPVEYRKSGKEKSIYRDARNDRSYRWNATSHLSVFKTVWKTAKWRWVVPAEYARTHLEWIRSNDSRSGNLFSLYRPASDAVGVGSVVLRWLHFPIDQNIPTFGNILPAIGKFSVLMVNNKFFLWCRNIFGWARKAISAE